MVKPKSDSTEQREAEKFIPKGLEKKLGLKFSDELPIDIKVKPDAVDVENKVIVEVYSRIGKVKGGQQHKIKGEGLSTLLCKFHPSLSSKRIAI